MAKSDEIDDEVIDGETDEDLDLDDDADLDLDLVEGEDGDLDEGDDEGLAGTTEEEPEEADEEIDEEDLEEETEENLEEEGEQSLDVLLAREKAADEEDLSRLDEPDDGIRTTAATIGADEFTCRSCFLVKNRAQLADEAKLICLDCA